MSIRQFSSRIELNFWQIVIGLMSESPKFQRLVRWSYLGLFPAVSNWFTKFNRRRAFQWAAGGLGFGIMIGFLIALF
ncbi:MAG: hypothetical protein ACK2UM_04470 [Anaerolineales bacterium]|jgi:hypothetical protein